MQPDCPVSRRGDLITLEVHKLVCRYVIREVVSAVSFKHSGEYDAVENDIVLADEVNHASLWVLPPLFPIIRAQLLGV